MNKTFAVILLIAAISGLSNLFLAEEENNAQAMRCEMFRIYKETNSQYGWPPKSNQAAADSCKAEARE